MASTVAPGQSSERTYLLGNILSPDNSTELGLYLDWRALVVRGIVSLIFSITAFAMPAATAHAFVLLFGLTFLCVGLVMMTGGLCYCQGLPFILGSLELATGVLVLMYQGLTALVLLYIVAFRMVFAGFLFLAIAWTGRSDYNTPPDLGISLGFSGLVFILAGVSLLAVHPAEGIVALVWVVAAQALVDAMVSFYAAYRMNAISLDAAGGPPPAIETA